MEQLKVMRKLCIDKLVTFIFPLSITEQPVKGHSRKASKESLKPEAISEIAEALHEPWKNHSDVKEFKIVAPSLNSNGNYQEYYDWIVSNKDGTVNSGMNAAAAGSSEPSQVATNPAFRIQAALTYVAQLVQALSFFLDVRLPHKCLYNDFCVMGLNEQLFRKKVARLNLNILHLCYSQNLQMKNLQPTRTMENIFQLLDVRNVEHFGRTGPVLDTSQRSVDSFTEIFDDHSDTDEDSDDTTLQWENVGNLPLVEISQSAGPQQQSMAGTIMNVAQSFWKWK